MPHVVERIDAGIVTLTIARPTVNAIDDDVVRELRLKLAAHETSDARAIVLTGQDHFFSFGFDVPHFLPVSKPAFGAFVERFAELYRSMFVYPKALVAAINGHAIAGGCMLALACDHRVMATGKARISLNEIGFASTVFAGSTEMLRFAAGSRNATRVLHSGAFFSAEEALEIGLVDAVATPSDLMAQATLTASDLGAKSKPAFASMKRLLRGPIAEQMLAREGESIREFLDIWYSPETRANLEKIVIRERSR